MAVIALAAANCPLYRLPDELVLEIICLVCNSGPTSYRLDTPYRSVEDIRTLAHTCARFRQLIKGSASEMDPDSGLMLCGPHPSIMQDLPLLCGEQWVDAAVGSGKTLPLIVRATIPEPDTQALRALVKALSLISHIGILILCGGDGPLLYRYRLYTDRHEHGAAVTTTTTTRPAPALTTLRLEYMEVDTLFCSEGLSSELPDLQIVQLQDCWIHWDSPFFRSTTLTKLELTRVVIEFDGSDGEPLGTFIDMLRPSSATLRELIVYHEHILFHAAPAESIGPASRAEPNLRIVDFLAFEKISLRIHAYAMARLLTRINAPNLRITHVAPIVGYTRLDSQHLRDSVLPLLCSSLLGGQGAFECILIDVTRPQDYMRVVATKCNRVLEMSLVPESDDCDVPSRRCTWNQVVSLRYILPDCMRGAANVHLVAGPGEDYRWELDTLLPAVVKLALHGPCAEDVMDEIACPGCAPLSLKTVTILWSPYREVRLEASRLSNVSNLIEDAKRTMRRDRIFVQYDTVLAPQTDAAGLEGVYAEAKEDIRRISDAVCKEWEEFAHSYVAKKLFDK